MMKALYNRTPLGALVTPLLAWYRANRRDLPWRENTDPYRVWVSEIMLQQTRVEAVKEYYRRFLVALPTIAALAEADEEQLLKLWEGLGYYSRVRNLQKAAQVIMGEHGGVFPSDPEAIEDLPGIGTYTAGAIASIAFGLPVPAVDGNVLRVITRLTLDATDITKESFKREVATALAEIYPPKACGDFTQALMELGAIICLPNGAPLCDSCPLASLCCACRNGEQEQYPVKKAKAARRIEHKTVFVLRYGDRIAVRRRTAAGVLSGMWELPCIDGMPDENSVRTQLDAWGVTGTPNAQKEKKHIFTHIEWIMHPYTVECAAPYSAFTWVEAEQIALPTAFKKLLQIH